MSTGGVLSIDELSVLVGLDRHEPLVLPRLEKWSTLGDGDLLKAVVWYWIIDKTLVLTSILSVCRLNEIGTCQVMEQEMIMVMMVMTTR